MKKHVVCLLTMAIASATIAQTQSSNASANAAGKPVAVKSPEADWEGVTQLLKSPVSGSTSQNSQKSVTQIQTEAAQRAATYRDASTAAKTFYTTYPTSVNAGEAKKVEASAALLGVTDDDKSQEAAALLLAKTYCADKTNREADRFAVALLSQRVQSRAKLGGTLYGHVPSELERIAEQLISEFEGCPQAYYFYASVAKGADMTTAARMAGKLLRISTIPSEAKADAELIMARQALVGTSLALKLPTTDGKEVDLGALSGKPTILYVISRNPTSGNIVGLQTVKKSLPSDMQVIYLYVGGSGEDLKLIQANAPIAGTFCFDTVANTKPLITALKITQTPYTFVFNRSGKVVGFGPPSSLQTLVDSATR